MQVPTIQSSLENATFKWIPSKDRYDIEQLPEGKAFLTQQIIDDMISKGRIFDLETQAERTLNNLDADTFVAGKASFATAVPMAEQIANLTKRQKEASAAKAATTITEIAGDAEFEEPTTTTETKKEPKGKGNAGLSAGVLARIRKETAKQSERSNAG